MYAEPAGFDRRQLTETLHAGWGFSVSSLRYEPVGFGTHHYVAQDQRGGTWWVNVDDLAAKTWIANDSGQALDGLERSLQTAVALRRAQLEFVHAPIERSKGGVVAQMDDRYAVSVFPYVDGRSNAFGEFASDDERRLVLGALGRMHNATDHVPAGLPRRDSLEIPLRQRFFASLDDLRSPWTGGPFSEPARNLLIDNAGSVRTRFDRYDELARAVRTYDDAWVVTHGEPHGGNIIRTPDDALLLIDWDTVAIGPRERDLWMVEPRNEEDWEAYTTSGGTSDMSPTAIELYSLWWTLAEIAGCTDTFRSMHQEDPNTRTTWAGFQMYIGA